MMTWLWSVVVCYSKTQADDCQADNSSNIFIGNVCHQASEFERLAEFNNYTCTVYNDTHTYEEAFGSSDCNYEQWAENMFDQRTGASEEYFK